MSDHPTMSRRRGSAPYKVSDDAPQEVWNFDMDAAPRDGSEVALRLDPRTEEYRLFTWRKSRRMVGYQWVPQEGWSDRFTRQMFFDLDPVAWARHDIIDGLRRG